MKCQMNLCLAVARNEVLVDTVLELHDASESETVRYNARLRCHYIGWALKIRIDDLDKDKYDCTWLECCTEAWKKMASVGIVRITNGEKFVNGTIFLGHRKNLPSQGKRRNTYHISYKPIRILLWPSKSMVPIIWTPSDGKLCTFTSMIHLSLKCWKKWTQNFETNWRINKIQPR